MKHYMLSVLLFMTGFLSCAQKSSLYQPQLHPLRGSGSLRQHDRHVTDSIFAQNGAFIVTEQKAIRSNSVDSNASRVLHSEERRINEALLNRLLGPEGGTGLIHQVEMIERALEGKNGIQNRLQNLADRIAKLEASNAAYRTKLSAFEQRLVADHQTLKELSTPYKSVPISPIVTPRLFALALQDKEPGSSH